MGLESVIPIVGTASLLANAVLIRRFGVDYYLEKYPRRQVIGECSFEDLDDAFKPGPFGLTQAAEVRFVCKGSQIVTGAAKDIEVWVLSVLAKKAKRIFEFGTCTGRTTYHLARNSSDDARVTTLTLAPEGRQGYSVEEGDDPMAINCALKESEYLSFFYSGTEVEGKIEQLFADSKSFDETPYIGSCDLIFVDGSHAYSYVKSDSEKALRMLKPGGIMLWHDYHMVRSVLPGVYDALNELSAQYPLKHVRGTSFVMYRKPLS
jgi:predicted O-methyltransferase YrrM